jgi:hypothetical protein
MSETSKHVGRAPMAAKSLTLAATARRPIFRGVSHSLLKWTPSTWVSTVATVE